MFGKQAGAEYNFGIRKNIRNDKTVIGVYGVNKEGGGGDMYYKASNMLNIIRQAINDDAKFRHILRGLNSTFYHQTVTTKQIEDFISEESNYNFSKVFDQYLRTTQIPTFEYYLSKNKKKIFYRWANCISGFELPLRISYEKGDLIVMPTSTFKSTTLPKEIMLSTLADTIEKHYYVTTKQVKA
jgi:hypothetical protein